MITLHQLLGKAGGQTAQKLPSIARPVLVGCLLSAWIHSAGAQLDSLLTPINPGALPTEMNNGSQSKTNAAGASERIVLTADAFIAELEKELSAKLSLNGELKLALTGNWQPIKVSASGFMLTITEMPQNGISSNAFIRVKISSGGETVGPIPIGLRAQLWQEVWVASKRLDRGQPLERSMLAAQKFDVLRERQQLISSDVDPAGLELSASIPAGRALTRREAVARPVIHKGQVVEAVIQQGAMAMSMKALAMENGAAGELIKMRNVESRKEFNAQVLNETKVQVHF